MTVPVRIPCLNPNCHRTAAMAADDDRNTKIVCGRCWRMLPLPLRNEWKRFTANERRLRRLVERRIRAGTISRETIEGIGTRRTARHDDIWRRIEACFKAPQTPVGLESFLREVGL